MSQSSSKRIAFVVNAITGKELRAGNCDVARVYHLLTDQKFGMCSGDIPIQQVESGNDFENTLKKILKDWDSANQLIFYFSGHGDVLRETFFLQFGLTQDDFYPFGNIINYLKLNGVSRAILILDACHSGAATGIKDTNDKILSTLNKDDIPQGIAIVASSQATQKSRELPDGSYSVFTDILCQAIETGLNGQPTVNELITVGDIVSYITKKLKNDKEYSDFSQRPVLTVNQAEAEIWLTKNISGSTSKQNRHPETVYIRTPEELKLLYEKTLPNFHPCINATLDDLDWELVKKYSDTVQSDLFNNYSREKVLSVLKFYSPISHEGRNVLHKSAVLCFSKQPDNIYPQARSVFVFGNPRDPAFKRESICGPLSYQVEKLIELTLRHIEKISFIAEDGLRREVEDIDASVIRELISNAIVHRNYESSETVKVTITSEVLEIQSPGKFLPDTSWDELIASPSPVSCPVDAAISQYLSRLLVFEGIGRGFDIFKEYIKTHGNDSITCSELVKSITCISLLRRQNTSSLRDIAGNIISLGGTKNKFYVTGINWDNQRLPEFDIGRYQEAILERYGYLNLGILDVNCYDYKNLKLGQIYIAQNVREVHELLPQIYEITKEHQRQLRGSNQSEAEISSQEVEGSKRVYFEQPIYSVLDIINNYDNYKHLAILGDPGSGKSTLLQYLALDWANSPINEVISKPIPLLIELRTYIRNRDLGQCKDFVDFLHQSPGSVYHINQHQLHKMLNDGKAFVMFDGLDEVLDMGKQEDVITDIHRFTNEYPNVQVIVTSRVIGYKPQRLRDADFRHFILQGLELKQIDDFICRWHELAFKDEVEKIRKRERLQTAINTSKAIGELAVNPLLLTIMALLNSNQELPRNRLEIYNQASRVLLHQWDVERALVEDSRLDIRIIDYKDKQAILRQVAYHMQANEKGLAGNLISIHDLERIIIGYLKTIEVSDARTIARLMINQLCIRNFILCNLGSDYYGFVHRAFLEYFCALEFLWQFEKTRTLTIEQMKSEVFGKHWQDESWHEVLCLIAGRIDSKFVGEILDYLIQQEDESGKFTNIFLASDCLLEVRNRSPIFQVSAKLLNQLKNLARYEVGYDYQLYGNNKTHLIHEVRTKAISAVSRAWRDDPDTLPWLKSLAQSDKDVVIQQLAKQEIGRGWKDEAEL